MLLPLLGSGCAFYKPKPVDLQQDTATWRALSLRLVPYGSRLSWKRIREIGLFLNADLNKARLTHLRSRNAAKYAGLWDDPTLSLSLDRYLKELQYDRAIATGLSIPVTGAPAIARKVAELYRQNDLLELRAAESDFLMRLNALAHSIRITHAKHDLIRDRMKQAEQERENISKLADAGETNTADVHDAVQRCSDLLKELQELENTHLSKHLELLSMMGLHPAVGDIEVADPLPHGVPAPIAAPQTEALLRHPRLLAAMNTYHTNEEELRLEIRKQFPNLEISPGYTKEEGNEKLSLSVGFTLPLWNRNREAIARAAGTREIGRHSALQQWRELQQQANALSRRQDLVLKHCRAEYERLTALQAAVAQQEELYRLGEIDLPILAGTRHEAYTRRLAYLDCLAELLEIQVALQYLAIPNPS